MEILAHKLRQLAIPMQPFSHSFRRRPGGRRGPAFPTAVAAVIFLSQAVVFAGSQYESAEGIRKQVQQFIDSYDFDNPLPVVSRVGKVDSRLRLQRCSEPLDIQFASDNAKPGRTILGVSCATGKPWTIYVTANIELFAQVLVSNKTIMRGQTLESDDIQFDTRKLSTLRTGYFTSIEPLQGMQVTRTIGVGRVINASLLRPRYLVTRGQQVTLVATMSGVDVRMKGKALANATSNKRVKVKNVSSGRIVEGLVVGEGIVKISM